MKVLDKMIVATADCDPGIIRHKDGNITLTWPVYYARPVSREYLAGCIGIDADMIVRKGEQWFLDVPKEVAEAEAK